MELHVGQNYGWGGRATGGQTRSLQRLCVGKEHSKQGLEWDMKELQDMKLIKPAGRGVQREFLGKRRAGSDKA